MQRNGIRFLIFLSSGDEETTWKGKGSRNKMSKVLPHVSHEKNQTCMRDEGAFLSFAEPNNRKGIGMSLPIPFNQMH